MKDLNEKTDSQYESEKDEAVIENYSPKQLVCR